MVTVIARCKLSAAGYSRMDEIRCRLNWLYNKALEERKRAWEERGESLSLCDQYKWLTQLRVRGERGLDGIAVAASRGMLKRLDEALQSFFRRVRAKQAPGFPRFRAISRCSTIEVVQVTAGMVKAHCGHYLIQIKGFPRIKGYTNRKLPDGQSLKVVRLTKRGRKWEASLVYAVEQEALQPSAKAVGIDLGVRKRMTCSDGTRCDRASRDWKRRRKLQRALARCVKGSRTRAKRRQALARLLRSEFVRQRNACHRVTTRIVREFGLIAAECLQVRNMTGSAKGTEEEPGSNVRAKAGLNREILSQNWSLLRSQLQYKAAWAGREYVEVNPKFTSQDCHCCGDRTDPGRSEVYRCNSCGLVMDRDVNAAMNIMAAGIVAAGASTWAVGPSVALELCA